MSTLHEDVRAFIILTLQFLL